MAGVLRNTTGQNETGPNGKRLSSSPEALPPDPEVNRRRILEVMGSVVALFLASKVVPRVAQTLGEKVQSDLTPSQPVRPQWEPKHLDIPGTTCKINIGWDPSAIHSTYASGFTITLDDGLGKIKGVARVSFGGGNREAVLIRQSDDSATEEEWGHIERFTATLPKSELTPEDVAAGINSLRIDEIASALLRVVVEEREKARQKQSTEASITSPNGGEG